MSKQILADQIAEDLLSYELLNEKDYSGDVVALLSAVTEKIIYRLKDYSIVSGEIF